MAKTKTFANGTWRKKHEIIKVPRVNPEEECGALKNIKAFMMWFYYTWEVFMNLKYNPFRFIGDVSMQMYWMTALSIAWTASFCALIAGWAGLIPLIFGHVLIIFAMFMTYATFKEAEKNNALWINRWKGDYN